MSTAQRSTTVALILQMAQMQVNQSRLRRHHQTFRHTIELMQLRPLGIWSALFTICVASAQDLSKKITYTTKAVSIQHAFSDLSTKIGTKLFVQPDLADEIVILRFQDVAAQDALQKIASAVEAEWKKTSDGYEM